MYEQTKKELERLSRMRLLNLVVEDDLGWVYNMPTDNEDYAIIRIYLYATPSRKNDRRKVGLLNHGMVRFTARRYIDEQKKKHEAVGLSAHDFLSLAKPRLKREVAFNLDLWIEVIDKRGGRLTDYEEEE
jgi:hypothetical protein